MSTLTWIVIAGLAMSALALSGSLTLVLPESTFARVVPPLVALAAGRADLLRFSGHECGWIA
jgi:zinc and cadmium transporter